MPNQSSLAWGKKVSVEFRKKVVEVASYLGTKPDYLMAIINYESNGTFRADWPDPQGGVGLICFLKKTAQDYPLNTTQENLKKMTNVEQLDYVQKYLNQWRGRVSSLEDLYMAVLSPAAIGKPNDFPVFREGTKNYKQNKRLDLNGDGEVTKYEASFEVRKSLQKGLMPENAAPVEGD